MQKAKKLNVAAASIMYDFSILRDLRKKESLTLQDVAARSGVSTAVISKLERNQTLAELGTLFKLSRVFGLTVLDVLALAESRTAQVKRATTRDSGGFHFQEIRYANLHCLFGKAAQGETLFKPEVHRDEYELCWVLAGKLRVVLPHERHDLAAGQSIQFDAVWEHSYKVLTDCECLIVHLSKGKRY